MRKPRQICCAGLVEAEADEERAQFGDDEAAGDGAPVAAAPAGQRRAADDDRGDGGEEVGRADGRIGGAAEAGKQDAVVAASNALIA